MDSAVSDRCGKLFDLYDFDGNGILSRKDVELMHRQVIEAFGLPSDSPKACALHERYRQMWDDLLGLIDADAVFTRLDRNGSGAITSDEYSQMWLEYAAGTGDGARLLEEPS